MAKKPSKPRLTPEETRMSQDAFLAAYGTAGSVKAACDSIDLSRSTVDSWNKGDVQGFRVRYGVAKDIFRDGLQDIAVNRVMQQKPGDNPVLLITLLNAHWPEKYRRDGQVATNEVKEMMVEWKKWARDNKKKGPKPSEVSETEEATKNAIDEVEKLLAKKSEPSDNAG